MLNVLRSVACWAETMMLGRSVVVNGSTSTEEKIGTINCVLVVENCNPESLAGALRFLREKPGITWQMGENGRRAFEKFYDWNFMTDRLAKLYQ